MTQNDHILNITKAKPNTQMQELAAYKADAVHFEVRDGNVITMFKTKQMEELYKTYLSDPTVKYKKDTYV